MENLEQKIQEEGLSLLTSMQKMQRSTFNSQYWLDQIMDLAMRDPKIKVNLFRLVDVLPSLSSDSDIFSHMHEYLGNQQDLPIFFKGLLKASNFSLGKKIASSTVKANVKKMAEKFILGTSIDDAKTNILAVTNEGQYLTIDLIGEETLNKDEALLFFEKYNNLITGLKDLNLKDVNVSVKLSSLCPYFLEEEPTRSANFLEQNIINLALKAYENDISLTFDMESFKYKEATFLIFEKLLFHPQLINWSGLGIVLQCYLTSSKLDLEMLILWAKKRRCPFLIRLVKGAYWDYEMAKSSQKNLPPKVFTKKEETDVSYELLSTILLDNIAHIYPAFGSHNVRSLANAIAYAKSMNITYDKFEIQMLYGMADEQKKAILEMGLKLRVYAPIGDLLPGMSYLVRRLLENTSQEGFIKLSTHDKKDNDELLKKPVPSDDKNNLPTEQHLEFTNCSNLDFSSSRVRKQLAQNISTIKEMSPFFVRPSYEANNNRQQNIRENFSPNDKTLFSKTSLGDLTIASDVVEICKKSFSNLANLGFEKRAEHLLALAQEIENERYFLTSLICLEVGKNIVEADAEICEAIDFCRFYAHLSKNNISSSLVNTLGEDNSLHLTAVGPSCIIGPFNFPFAILCGMAVGSYVCGNPIILKPAERAPVAGQYLHKLMMKAGFIKDACHFLPSLGKEVGEYLTSHRDIKIICFTGSLSAGLKILQKNDRALEQKYFKKIICEMGGKNAIIIDSDADIDEALNGVVKSAFSFAGQKCSALSRLIVLENIYDSFITRLKATIDSILIGPSYKFDSLLTPVIDEDAHNRLLSIIKKAKEKKIKYYESSTNIDHLTGYFVKPTLFEIEDSASSLLQEEMFGPILCVQKAKDIASAVLMVNDSSFALTAAIFSRSPKNIAFVKQNIDVGNLYINQGCTGAVVARQPFGGHKLSGTGFKAGGPHYLLNFVNQKTICENTMRRGFSPKLCS